MSMTCETNLPVLNIWTVGMPVTLGEDTMASRFGIFLGKADKEGFVKVQVKIDNKPVIENWRLSETFAEN